MFNPGFHLTQILSQSRDLAKDPSQFINPHTGQSYTKDNVIKIIGDFIAEYDKGMNKQTEVVKDKLEADMPTPDKFNADKSIKGLKQFQIAAQYFIRNIPLEFKVEYLNKMQKKCPNIIVDPNLRLIDPIAKDKLQYGLADVYRFIGLPLNSVKIGKYKSKKQLYRPKVLPKYNDVHGQLQINPFYAPVEYSYSIPDVVGNNAMQQIYVNNPHNIFKKLKNIYYNMMQMKGGGTFDEVTDTINTFYIKGNIKDMIKLIDHLLKKALDPLYLTNTLHSKTVQDGHIFKPPMAQYFNDNFNNLMYQLLMSHRLYQIDSKPATNKLQITSPMMNDFMNSYHHYNQKPMVMVKSYYKPLGSKKSQKSRPRKIRKRKSRKRKSSY